jgi:hypothetical protein
MRMSFWNPTGCLLTKPFIVIEVRDEKEGNAVPINSWIVVYTHNPILSPRVILPTFYDAERWVSYLNELINYLHDDEGAREDSPSAKLVTKT